MIPLEKRVSFGISPLITNYLWKEADVLIRFFVTMLKNTKQRQSP